MSNQLTVTMFDVGFGDCFLVEIPTVTRMCRILFDCGRHTGGDAANQALATEVIKAATDPDGVPRIDLIVATHRHKDHVSGFKMKGWEEVEVREVWMPWTEDPEDPKARGIADRQVRAAAAAVRALAIAAPALRAKEEASNRQMSDIVGLALTNEAAMDTLYHGFAGNAVRRYLPDPVSPLEPLTLPSAPGVRFHIMGPPRAEATLGTMDPPKAETFRRLAAATLTKASGHTIVGAFGDVWVVETPPNDLFDVDDQKTVIDMAATASLIGLSAAIDNAINNTSLVIMIEVGSAFLLFCADAQWGNWQTILAEKHWCDLIGRCTFLKVGHHASSNASPVTLIDKLLPDGIPAMISVDPSAYPPSVPYDGLLKAFAEHGYKVARSDVPQAINGYEIAPGGVCLKIDF